MTSKVPCASCSRPILSSTSENNDGMCLPCKGGYRENIERNKKQQQRERELDRTCPFRAYWRELVTRVYETEGGFTKLSDDEKLYYSVSVLDGEVYNGGFEQYFSNSSGETYLYAEYGLIQLGATKRLDLLRAAKTLVFGSATVPKSRREREKYTASHKAETELGEFDAKYYGLNDDLEIALDDFAVSRGLIVGATKRGY